jgi:hypothetical protein
MAAGARGNRGAAPGQMGQMNLGQFLHSMAGMNLNSSLGTFKMSYANGINGTANALGNVGRGSAQATFTTPTFDGMFNFSAGAASGSGGSRTTFSTGLTTSNKGAFRTPSMGAGANKQPKTSLTMRMSF